MTFFHRHYCNICPGQRPINPIAGVQDCPPFLQHFEEASMFETRRISFNTSDALLIKLDEMQFSKFLKLRLFSWKSSNHHKCGFRMIISIR